MRESQMKKIIALAVAGAFVAPAFAADVTLTGEVEYTLSSSDGVNDYDTSQADLLITATETLDNGMTVSAYISPEAANGSADNTDTLLTLTGSFGELTVGDDGDYGYNAFDNKTDVASSGGDFSIDSGNANTIGGLQFKPNLGIEGLSVAIGYAAGDAAGEEESGFGIQYAAGGFAVSYGKADVDGDDTDASHVSLSYSSGPFYVAYDNYETQGGTDGDATTAVAGTYTMGDIKFFVERATIQDATNMDVNDTIYGLEYGVGPLDLYIVQITDQTAASATTYTEADTTRVGVEYQF
jgi:hypothetical protein